MKTIGLIGGVSFSTTIDYYWYVNNYVNVELGELNYAQCIIHSVNFAEIKKRNDAGDFSGTLDMLANACLHMKNSGAECIVLCGCTIHMFAEGLAERVGLPLIHVADATAAAVKEKGVSRVGLLGSKSMLEQGFFKDKLTAQGIGIIVPGEEDADYIDGAIFRELIRGYVAPEARERFLEIVLKLVEQGAEGIIIGCTEIPSVVFVDDVPMPLFDTTRIHAKAAVEFSLGRKLKPEIDE